MLSLDLSANFTRFILKFSFLNFVFFIFSSELYTIQDEDQPLAFITTGTVYTAQSKLEAAV